MNQYQTLPCGWSFALLKQVIKKLVDGSHNPPPKQEHGFPMLSARNIENGQINFNDYRFIEKKAFEIEDKRTQVRPGDVLLTIVGAIGRTATVPDNIPLFTLQRSVAVLSPLGMIPDFLMYQLQSPQVQQELLKEAKGTAQKGIYLKKLGDIPVLLPPLNEQHRIVAKIEALSARSQRVKEALLDIPQLLDQFRQSVLAAAFRGDLTADWRSQNPDVEPASNLLSLIDTPSPEHHLNVFEKSSDYKLPSSWVWVQLGKLGSLVGGGTPSKSNSEFWNGSIPWVSPKDMKQDRINDSIDHISEEAVNKSSAKKIPKGSILFVVRGMILNHTLPVAITDTVVTINQDMKALVPELNEMSEYLLIVSKFASNKMLFWVKAATHGTRRLESPILKDWAIPIPPLREQKEIVNRVKSFFKAADTIQQQYQETKAHLDQLDQSILAKAFRGELVPQDPNDEPASVLLERIREERAKIQTKTAKKSTTATSARRTKKTQPQEESVQLELGLE